MHINRHILSYLTFAAKSWKGSLQSKRRWHWQRPLSQSLPLQLRSRFRCSFAVASAAAPQSLQLCGRYSSAVSAAPQLLPLSQ